VHEFVWLLLIICCAAFMRILQPQTKTGPRIFSFCFSCFFPVFYHSPIVWNCHFHFFHSPIMCKCHSDLFIVFPSCAIKIDYIIIMFILVLFWHFAIMYRKWIEAKSETEKIICSTWEVKWKLKETAAKNEKREKHNIH
jgi:hypothetical protein